MQWAIVASVVGLVGCRQLLGIEGAEVERDGAVPIDVVDDGAIHEEDVMVVGHDEDDDSIPDIDDNCPTVPNTNQQTAGDTVGVACDPRVTTGDRIAFFVPFYPAGQPADIMGGTQFELDYVTMNGGEVATQTQYTATRFEATFSDTTIPVGTANIELVHGNSRCRVGPCSGSGTYCLRANGNSSTSETDVLLDSTAFRIELDQVADKVVCRVHTSTTETTTMADITATNDDRARVRVMGCTAHLASIIVYVVPP